MEDSDFQKSQLPDTSIDDSPFINIKSTRLRKKKTQSKLMFSLKTTSKKKKSVPKQDSGSHDPESADKDVEKSEESANSGNLCSDKQENTVIACPVCWKKLESSEKVSHMKSCATKHNLTLKQLLDAVDLQTKQIEERKILGLPCVPTTIRAKTVSSRKSSSANDINDPDLQLGLALSVSMSECEDEKHLMEQQVMLEAGLGSEVAANQATLLEKFGFTSTRPVLPSIYSRTRAGKQKFKGTPQLLTRTQEERERLITEKVAIILTNEEDLKPMPPYDVKCEIYSDGQIQSETLFQLQNKECSLWKKAGSSPSVMDIDIYYVKPLSHVITPSKIRMGTKLKHLSQVPCRLKSPSPNESSPKAFRSLVSNVTIRDTKKSHLNLCGSPEEQTTVNSPCEFSLQDQNNSEAKSSINDANNIKTKSNCDFVNKLADNWKNLLNNSNMSDVIISVENGENIYAHKLVLLVRCPCLLHEIKEKCNGASTMKYIDWSKIPFNCALAFLYFIYCGSVCKINELTDGVDKVAYLSQKYCVEELFCYLKCTFDLCSEVGNISSVIHSEDYILPQNEICCTQNSYSHVEHFDKSEIERSKKFTPKEKENDIRAVINKNTDQDDQCNLSVFPHSAQQNVILCSPTSPDPFSDSCYPEGTISSHSQKYVSPNTQHDIDQLLIALSSSDENFHERTQKQSMPNDSNKSGEMCDLKDSSQQEKNEVDNALETETSSSASADRNATPKIPSMFLRKTSFGFGNGEDDNEVPFGESLFDSSTVKRKHSDENDDCSSLSDAKRVCCERMNSVRKSLLRSFSSEENSLTNEKKVTHVDLSGSSGNGDDVNVIEMVARPLKNGPLVGEVKEFKSSQISKVDDALETSVSSFVHNKAIPKNSSSICIKETSFCLESKEEIETDALGDLCADYEYQNIYSRFSPCNDVPYPQSKTGEEECVEIPLKVYESPSSVKSLKSDVQYLEESYKSPFSSPLSVKSLPTGDSPFLLNKYKHSREKNIYRKGSNSDLSVNSHDASSPLSVKCLSQDSIHLKTFETVVEKNKNIPSDCTSKNRKFGKILSAQDSSQSSKTPSTHILKTSSQSLSSVKRLLEDSFTVDLENNVLDVWPCSTPKATEPKTSVQPKCFQNIQANETCVTPMADYSEMDTPTLKKELQKFGLKPLKRKRAKKMLRHIYNELHPLVPMQQNEMQFHPLEGHQASVLPSSCHGKGSQKKLSPVKNSQMTGTPKQGDESASKGTEEVEDCSENEFPSTQESSSSSRCEFEFIEDLNEEIAFTQTDVTELPSAVHNFITSNPIFYQQVLQYEPIWLEGLQDGLKSQNYKFKLDQLMDYLDEECITFRTAQGSKTRKRQKKRKE